MVSRALLLKVKRQKEIKMKLTADIIVKCRWPIIIAFIVIAGFFAAQIPKAERDPDMINQLPTDMPSRISTDKIEELFGGTDMLMVLIKTDDVLNAETLSRVKKISKQMKKVNGVDKVYSLFELKHIKSQEGAMIVDPAVKQIPHTEEQKKKLRKEIMGNDMVYGSVVSKDFTITSVIAVLKADISDEHIVGEMEKLIEENPGKEQTIIGGVPFNRLNVSRNTQSDLRRLLPIGLLTMLVFLYFCFKQLRGVLLPFFVVIMAILLSMGLIPLLGWKISVISIILPVFLIAVANDYGIHMIAKYQEDNVPGNGYSKEELAKRMFSSLGKPVLLTGITTMIGMLCLNGHIMIGAKQLSVLASLGIAFALAASLFFIPAVVSLLPKSKPVILPEGQSRKKPILERLLTFFSDIVSRKPKIVIAGSFVFSAIVSIGIFFVTVDADPVKYFAKDHPVAKATNLINENLGGTFNFSVVVGGDIKEPRIMKKIDRLEAEIEKIPEVGNTSSIARVVRQMSRALNDKGEDWYDRIPGTRNAVAQYFELYSMSGDPDDFEKMIDFPYKHALISARLNTTSTPKINRVMRQVNDMAGNDSDIKYVGGIALIYTELAKHVVNGQFLSLSMAVVAVAVLLMVLFRSVAAGLISAIPMVLSLVILFGLMGLLGIELNVVTALLSSIIIGVGIDYTIHFLWRCREERRSGLTSVDAVKKTLSTTGRGIVFNAFSVIIGFFVLLISNFMPVKFFGFLIVVSILACLIGALSLVPALCIVLKPKFLEPKEFQNERIKS
jgi:predicted RND superfamily exporter protein